MPNFMEKLNSQKAAIYIRVSTIHQIDKDSLEVQRRELTAYCEMILGIRDFEVFEDAGFSAKDTKRPAFQRMMNQLRTGEFSHLLVWKIDRISRNLLDFAGMYAELKQSGVAFISKNEQFDTSSAIGEAMLKIILVFAELERNMTSERVTAVMLSRANAGKWNGGHVPYGYTYNTETGEFQINAYEASVVKRMFELYEHEQSILYISKYLDEKQIRTKRGNNWSTASVHHVLTNIFYVGDYRYNTRNTTSGTGKYKDEEEWILFENHHEPIIDREYFNRIQFLLKRNRRTERKQELVPVQSIRKKHVHLFGTLLKCGNCGHDMWSTPGRTRADGFKPSAYGCKGLRTHAYHCDGKFVSDNQLGPFILNYIYNMMKAKSKTTNRTTLDVLETRLLSGEVFGNIRGISEEGLEETLQMFLSKDELIEYKPAIVKSKEIKIQNDYDSLQKRKRQLENALQRLQALYIYDDNAMSEKDYMVQKESITAQLEKCNEDLDALTAENPSVLSGAENFVEKASYFLMAQQLISARVFDFDKLVSQADASTIHAFLRTIIHKIEITDGRVTSIIFQNGIVHQFIYS